MIAPWGQDADAGQEDLASVASVYKYMTKQKQQTRHTAKRGRPRVLEDRSRRCFFRLRLPPTEEVRIRLKAAGHSPNLSAFVQRSFNTLIAATDHAPEVQSYLQQQTKDELRAGNGATSYAERSPDLWLPDSASGL